MKKLIIILIICLAMIAVSAFFSSYTYYKSQSLTNKIDEILSSLEGVSEKEFMEKLNPLYEEWIQVKNVIDFCIENDLIDDIETSFSLLMGQGESIGMQDTAGRPIIYAQIKGELFKLAEMFRHLHETEKFSFDNFF